MDSEKYFSWCFTDNKIATRLKENSLVHTFSSESKISKRTKLLNIELKKYPGNRSYSQFLKCKKKILKSLTENQDITDESDFSDADYKTFYNSFDVFCIENSKTDVVDECFQWQFVEKKGLKKVEPDDHHNDIWEDNIDSSLAENDSHTENAKETNKSRTAPKKVQQIINNTINEQCKYKVKNLPLKSPTIVNNKNNISDSNVGIKNTKSKIALKNISAVKRITEIKDSKPKKIGNKKSLQDVKRNLIPLMTSVSAKHLESSEGDSNDEFTPSDFQAQSTQIFTDTFSETYKKKHKNSINIHDRLSQKETINQPRDSGIDEDSREDSTKYIKIDNKKSDNKKVNENHCNETNTKNEGDSSKLENKIEENDSKEKNDKIIGNNINDINDLAKKQENNFGQHKLPLIIGEERLVKKYKIITNNNRDEQLKPISKEEFLESKFTDKSKGDNLMDKKEENSSESNSEYMDSENIENSKSIQNIQEDKGESSDEYYDLYDNSSKSNSEDESENIRKNKTEFKEKLARCNSPYLTKHYKELKKLRLLEDSQDSEVELNKVQKHNKQLQNSATKSSYAAEKLNVKESEKNKIETTSSTLKIKKLDKLLDKTALAVTNNNYEDSDDISDQGNEEPEKTVIEKQNSITPDNKKCYQQMKRMDVVSSDEDLNDNDIHKNEDEKHKVDKNNYDHNIEKDKSIIFSDSSQSSHSKKSESQSEEIETQQDLTNIVNNYNKIQLTESREFNNNVNKSDDSEDDDISPYTQKRLQQIKRLDLLNGDDTEDSEEEDIITNIVDKKKSPKSNKIKSTDNSSNRNKDTNTKYNNKNLTQKKNLDSSSDEETNEIKDEKDNGFNGKEMKNKESEEKGILSSNTNNYLQLANDECNSDIDIEEHKVSMPSDFKETDTVRNIDESSSSKLLHEIEFKSPKKLMHDKINKISDEKSSEGSQDIDVVHYSSENETNDNEKYKTTINCKSDVSEKDKEVDVDNLSPEESKRLKLLKRLNLFEENEEESEEEVLNKLSKQIIEKDIDKKKTLQTDLKKNTMSSDDESDEESEKSMSPSISQRLSQFRKMNLLNNNNSSSSEDEKDIVKSKILSNGLIKENKEILKKQTNLNDFESDKSDTEKSQTSNTSRNKSEKVNSLEDKSLNENLTSETKAKDSKHNVSNQLNTIEEIKDGGEDTYKNEEHVIINETQESTSVQENLGSQEMFSSLEDLTEKKDEDQLKLNGESEEEINDVEINTQIPPTPQLKEKMKEKITKISQLVEKENLSEGNYNASIAINDISAEEEVFILSVPKNVFDNDLIGEKISFSKTRLMFGTEKYEAFQRRVSPTFSCVLKSGKNRKNMFKTLNVRPVVSIVTRRKRERDEEFETSSKSLESESIDDKNDDKLLTNSEKKKKIKNDIKLEEQKKVRKRKVSHASIEVENEERISKKVKPAKNKFSIESFMSEAPTKMTVDKESLKENRTLKRKLLKVKDDDYYTMNDEAFDYISDSSEDSRVQINKSKVGKTESSVLISPGNESEPITKKLEDNKVVSKTKYKSKLKNSKGSADIDEIEKIKKGSPNKTKKTNENISKVPSKKGKVKNQSNKESNEKAKSKPEYKNQKPKRTKKKVEKVTTESAAEQIKKLIAKNIKFNKEKFDSSNSSSESSKYNPLDITRSPAVKKRYESTSSSSDENEKKFTRRSFQIRVKPKPENDEKFVKPSTSSSFISKSPSNTLDKKKFKSEDKKKKIYFDE